MQSSHQQDINDHSLRYMDITLDDLEVIATLGVGGFGRVELVKVMMMMVIIYSNTINWIKNISLQCRNRPSTAFALKCLKKQVVFFLLL